MNGRRGNRPNNNSFNSRRGNDRNGGQYRQGQQFQGQPRKYRHGPVPRRAGGGQGEYNVANVDNGVEFVLASVEAIQQTPKKFSFADRLAKSHEDRITEHLQTSAEQTITVATQHDAFDQLFNDASDTSSDATFDDTVMVSENELNGFDGMSLKTNMSGASELYNECALFNSDGTSTHPLDNELRDTSSSKADELTLDASIPAEIDSSFDQSNNEVFKADKESPKDTSINDWQKLHRVGPREHNPNMFCQRCETYGHTRDRCQFSQAIDGLTEHLARTIEPGEPNNTNNGQNHESEDHEDENIFQIDVDSDDAQDTDAHGNTINPTDNAYDGDDDVYDGKYTITSGSTEATEASTSHNWSPQDENSIVQVCNGLDDDVSVGPLPDEVFVTHEEVLPTLDQTHHISGQQNTSAPQSTGKPVIDTGAALNVTNVVTPEKRTSTLTPEAFTQLAIRQGWTATLPDITSEPYARRISLPIAQQVARKVMTSGPHLADADTLQKMIDEQREHNHNVYMANKESLDQGQTFIQHLKAEGLINAKPQAKEEPIKAESQTEEELINAEPQTEAELLLSNMDFVPPNQAERMLAFAMWKCPQVCRYVWFNLRQLSIVNRQEGAILPPLSREENRQRVCTRNCRQMWQQMADAAAQQGIPFPPMRNGIPNFRAVALHGAHFPPMQYEESDFHNGQHPDE